MQILLISASGTEGCPAIGTPEALASPDLTLVRISPHDLSEALSSPAMIGRHFDAIIVDPDALAGVEWLLNLLSNTGRAALLLSLVRDGSTGNEATLRRLGVDYVLPAGMLHAPDLAAEIRRLQRRHDAHAPPNTVAEHAPDALVGVDAGGTIRFFNVAAERLFGHAAEKMVGQTLSMLLPARFRAGHEKLVTMFRDNSDADTHMAWRRGVFALHADNHEIPVEVSLSRLDYGDGRLMLAAIRDISDRLSQEAEYYRLATHDSLTGLFNRATMWDILKQDMIRVRRSGQDMSLLLVDVDRFKQVNDTLGHLAGDEVLRAIANCIAGSMRAGDACCRFGGEEFVILLPRTAAEEAMQAAERLRAAIAGLQIMTRAGRITCTVSIGVAAIGPAGPQDGEALIHAADMAMLEAKRAGRNRVRQRQLEPA